MPLDNSASSLVFQAIVNTTPEQPTDHVWIHPNGKIVAVISGDSEGKNPAMAADFCRNTLQQVNVTALQNDPCAQLAILHKQLGSKNLKAHIGLIIYADHSALCVWVGKLQLYQISINDIDVVINEPSPHQQVLGQSGGITPHQKTFTIADDSCYLLSTAGLSHEAITANHAAAEKAASYQDWHDFGRRCQVHDNWCFTVFPIERMCSYDNANWPYNPFVCLQEDQQHEKLGLARIADALFKQSDFDGFKIVGRVTYTRKNSTRRLDGILVSPWGVVLLELKDHRGLIELDTFNDTPMRVHEPELSKQRNPLAKIKDVMPAFGEFDLGLEIKPLGLRKIGAVVFTNPNIQLKTYHHDGSHKKNP